jgi:hypothetical protein
MVNGRQGCCCLLHCTNLTMFREPREVSIGGSVLPRWSLATKRHTSSIDEWTDEPSPLTAKEVISFGFVVTYLWLIRMHSD